MSIRNQLDLPENSVLNPIINDASQLRIIVFQVVFVQSFFIDKFNFPINSLKIQS